MQWRVRRPQRPSATGQDGAQGPVCPQVAGEPLESRRCSSLQGKMHRDHLLPAHGFISAHWVCSEESRAPGFELIEIEQGQERAKGKSPRNTKPGSATLALVFVSQGFCWRSTRVLEEMNRAHTVFLSGSIALPRSQLRTACAHTGRFLGKLRMVLPALGKAKLLFLPREVPSCRANTGEVQVEEGKSKSRPGCWMDPGTSLPLSFILNQENDITAQLPSHSNSIHCPAGSGHFQSLVPCHRINPRG